jgi:hypothetical protein
MINTSQNKDQFCPWVFSHLYEFSYLPIIEEVYRILRFFIEKRPSELSNTLSAIHVMDSAMSYDEAPKDGVYPFCIFPDGYLQIEGSAIVVHAYEAMLLAIDPVLHAQSLFQKIKKLSDIAFYYDYGYFSLSFEVVHAIITQKNLLDDCPNEKSELRKQAALLATEYMAYRYRTKNYSMIKRKLYLKKCLHAIRLSRREQELKKWENIVISKNTTGRNANDGQED